MLFLPTDNCLRVAMEKDRDSKRGCGRKVREAITKVLKTQHF